LFSVWTRVHTLTLALLCVMLSHVTWIRIGETLAVER
jgi:hypothetical protein